MISGSGKSNMVVSYPLSFHYLHGGMGPTAKVVYKKVGSMIATEHDQSYTVMLLSKPSCLPSKMPSTMPTAIAGRLPSKLI